LNKSNAFILYIKRLTLLFGSIKSVTKSSRHILFLWKEVVKKKNSASQIDIYFNSKNGHRVSGKYTNGVDGEIMSQD
jgi:hypothetical protein